jgi:hypothetical protein
MDKGMMLESGKERRAEAARGTDIYVIELGNLAC